MNKQRKIKRIIEPETTTDGAGVKMQRSIATANLDYLDPFLLFDHFGSENPGDYIAGFPMHPHRGIETVTYMLKGEIKHRDSKGNEGVIGPGDVQWMTAGSGIMHEEMPKTREGELEGFQLWVNLPAKNKMMRPRYQEFRCKEIPNFKLPKGGFIKVIAGEFNKVSGSIKGLEANPTYLDIKIGEEDQFELELPENQTVFSYVFRGSANFEFEQNNEKGKFIDSPKLLVFGDGNLIKVKASAKGVRFLLVTAQSLNEPVARYGPFVMNKREEIEQALKDLQTGNFVKS